MFLSNTAEAILSLGRSVCSVTNKSFTSAVGVGVWKHRIGHLYEIQLFMTTVEAVEHGLCLPTMRLCQRFLFFQVKQ